MNKKSLLGLAALGLLATGTASASGSSDNNEKCYGVAKKGMNDCGNKKHGCGGKAPKDGMKTEWMYVPKGLCSKLAHGSLTAPKAVKKKAKK